MPENNTTNKIALLNVDVPDSIDHAVENLSKPITTNAGQTFGDLWFLVLGGISQLADKRKMKYAVELEKYKKQLETQIDAIPVEKRVEPDLQIVGPALENSKYCVESEEIRTAFANLISRSMNQDYSQYVHPSFADILKQMSPLDAQNMCLFRERKSYPVCDIHLKSKGERGYKILGSNLFVSNNNQDDFELQAQSISSLVRFGLVEIPEQSSLAEESLYDAFETNPLYLAWKKSIPEEIGTISLKKKKIDITPLGEAFIKACL